MSATFTTMTYDPNQQVRGSAVYQGEARPAVNEFHSNRVSSGLQSHIHRVNAPGSTTRVVRASDDISVYQNEYSASIESRELKPTHWSGGVFSSEAHRLSPNQDVLSPKSLQIRNLEAEFTKPAVPRASQTSQVDARNGLSGAASDATGDHYLRSFCFPDYMRAQAADSAGEMVSPRSRHFLDTTSAADWSNRGQPAAAFWDEAAPNANAAPAPAQSYTTRPVSELPFNYSLAKQASDAGNPATFNGSNHPKLPAPAPSQFAYSDYVKAKNISDAGGLVSPRSQHYLSTTTAADWTTRYVHQREQANPAAMSPAQQHSYHDLAKSRNSFR